MKDVKIIVLMTYVQEWKPTRGKAGVGLEATGQEIGEMRSDSGMISQVSEQ
jgi:hypothetical protein